MNYIVCDDNELFADDLKRQICECEPNAQVKVFNTVSALKYHIRDIGANTDALFMDIKINESNGIDLAVSIVREYPNMKIIYVTGYGEEYSQSIFECPAEITPTAFLVKPVKRELLENALARIKEPSAQEAPICFKAGRSQTFVRPDEIHYIMVLGRKISVAAEGRVIEYNGTLSECIKHLPEYFVQCHKSYCVNLRHITGISGWREISLKGGDVVPISRGFVESFRTAVTLNNSELSE